MPHPIVLVALLIVLLGAVLIVLKRVTASHGRHTTGQDQPPFRKADYLLSKAERSFYEVLVRSVGSEYVVFAKIRLLDLLWLPKGTSNAQSWRNRVQSKHVDFVLCRRDILSPVLAIELDDASHERRDRQERDALVDQVLSSAGLPMLRVPAKGGYAQAELVQRIREKIQSQSAEIAAGRSRQ